MSADTPFETVLHAPAPVAGLIFDMDGTLVDNMHVHNDAWEVWHQRRGLPFDRATFFQATAGRANREVVRAAMPDASELELDTLGLDKETIYREIYSGRMAPMPSGPAPRSNLSNTVSVWSSRWWARATTSPGAISVSMAA